MPRQPYLATLDERVVVFDGAFGTVDPVPRPRRRRLRRAEPRGLQRVAQPDPSRRDRRHARRVPRRSAATCVETDTFGGFAVVLDEYGMADRAYELNEAGARIARGVAGDYATDGRPLVAGSIGPGTKLPSLGHIAFADLRDAYEAQASRAARRRRRPAADRDLPGPAAGEGGHGRCPPGHAAAGREVPLQVQVTIETTGGCCWAPRSARRSPRWWRCGPTSSASTAPPARPRCASTCATCRQRPGADQRAAQRRAAAHRRRARRTTTWTPEHLAETHAPLRHRVRRGRRRRLLRHDARAPRRGGRGGPRPRAAAAPARALEPRVSSIYARCRMDQDRVSSYRRAHERERLAGVPRRMLAGDWDGVLADGHASRPRGRARARRVRRLRRPRRRADMDEIVPRFATQASVPLVLDSTEPPVVEVALQHIGGRASSTRSTSRTGSCPAAGSTGSSRLPRDYGAAVICLLIDERGPGPRRRSGSWRWPTASTRSPPSVRAVARRT